MNTLGEVPKFPIKTRARIDHSDIIGVVTGILYREDYVQYEVEWFQTGARQSGWFDEWRLEEWG